MRAYFLFYIHLLVELKTENPTTDLEVRHTEENSELDALDNYFFKLRER